MRSSRLAGRGPGLTGDRLLWLGYEVFTGEEEVLLAALGGPLELHGVRWSPLEGERRDPGVRVRFGGIMETQSGSQYRGNYLMCQRTCNTLIQ